VTRADSPRVVPVHVEQRPDGFAARLSAPGGNRTSTLLAFTSRRIRKPDAIVAHAASIWARPDHAADLVVIGHHDLLGSVEPLRALRVSQGMAVAVIDVENLYDEFGFGSKSPQAIRDFLRNAVAAWNTAPRFVLLLGDASLDPKNYLGNGDYDFVPTRLLDIHTMETASDGWFADFSGTGVPALAIGRLPVRTSAEADRLIAKLLDYEHGTTTGGVLLVSGTARGYDFAAASERISGFLTESVAVDQIQFDAMPLAAAKAALFQHLGSGERIVNYQGHGSVDRWGSSLLAGSDAPSLTNAPLSVFFMFTCLNGYFHDPALDSLAESLLKAGPGGAVAVYASSGMSDSADEDALNSELFQRLFTSAPQAPRGVLGEAALAALAAVKNTDVRRTYHLFGDPTMRLP